MNILLAPFCYIMSELEAFYCFGELIARRCPAYVHKSLVGVHRGCRHVDSLLQLFDAELHAHLSARVATDVYSFRAVMTLLACMKPLSEVIRVWDVLLALGAHYAVVMYTAHVVSMKNDLMSINSAYRY